MFNISENNLLSTDVLIKEASVLTNFTLISKDGIITIKFDNDIEFNLNNSIDLDKIKLNPSLDLNISKIKTNLFELDNNLFNLIFLEKNSLPNNNK
jgi:hypothetical protein